MSAAAIFGGPGPQWFSIPAHRPFAEDLARGLWEALIAEGPEALAQAVVLTPTRRGARALSDAFLKAAGTRALLPPQILPLGDLDEGEPPFEPGDLALDLPAAIDPLRRRFELTGLVKAHEGLLSRELDAVAALELADALGGFLDSLQIEEISAADGLAELVEDDLAEHWRISRTFLEAALEDWPRRLAELGLVDVSQRRVQLLRALAEKWTAEPPSGRLLAAGSTGTAPATADLLAVIARAPQGCVVLPGLDEHLADSAWAQVEEQHPQGAMKRLLDRAGIERGEVAVWPASRPHLQLGHWRRRVINEALRPAEATADWLNVIGELAGEGPGQPGVTIARGFEGMSLVSARSEEEAATVAALLLREALETPGMTAALVSPDQALSRRVAARLARWGIAPDSSAGEALAGRRCGVLAHLLARAAADPLDPVLLLGLLKHPFTRLGLSHERLEALAVALEEKGLRGARPQSWEALERRLAGKGADACDLSVRLRAALEGLTAPFLDGPARPAAAAEALARAMEAFAADETGATGELWGGNGGEAMSRLLAGLIHESAGLPPTGADRFADLLDALMAAETVRTGGATHPRLRILGAIEARLVRADRLIVAGLEEGVWPKGAPLDPFLSRPMRRKLGLPPPERRIGLAAHDFAQAACAPDVVLLHAERREGAPAVKSRWLWRLETLAKGAGVEIPGRPELLAWARALDAPGPYSPARRPAPVPPVEHRPREMFVTRVETLTRDPYAVWARDILKLYPLDRPDEAVEARARGTAIHKAFEIFSTEHAGPLPDDAAQIFERLYLDALVEAGMPAEALVREAALAREAAAWVIELERDRRDGRVIHIEQQGELTIDAPAGPFTLKARADRIEVTADGFGHVLDYKTGKAPSKKEVATGFSPQLTLTAAILAGGGFDGLGRPTPGDLAYLEITGRKPAGRVEVRAAAGPDAQDAAAKALAGLAELVARFDNPAQPYLSRVAPQFVKARISDYDHLARVFEWSTSGEDGEE
ncbi:MAG: double-strand break repair protein AddB [Phenylobacterium sp.]|jgi:ATP-dependent helicase/nuclease subunit B|uniref:double-strand break repair protein AddB n=1 Tax=Phenylobacterium sp. TaxID=1871053 RepID=UPI002A36292D|nr:double-strand break repair protein AddB [Phenylobacterium sp.]MDX9996540.1 double-strand break repair protein AddB [Phenylobacterium sp.]